MLSEQLDLWKERFDFVKSNLSFILVRLTNNNSIEVLHNSTSLKGLISGNKYDIGDIFIESKSFDILERKPNVVLTTRTAFHPVTSVRCFAQKIQDEQASMWVPESNSSNTSDLLASAAHDLRSPIHSVLGLANIIELQAKSDNLDKIELLKIAQMIKSSCSEAIDFTDDVLEMSSIESSNYTLEKEGVHMVEFVQEYLNTHRLAALRKGIYVSLTNNLTANDLAYINKIKITRVLDNLMSNAVKFSSNGSQISVTIGQNTSGLYIAIKDSGIGMSEKMVQSIFTKFGGSRRKGLSGEKSHGLGMPIVKNIMDLHDGTIEIKSIEDLGTEIILTFKN